MKTYFQYIVTVSIILLSIKTSAQVSITDAGSFSTTVEDGAMLQLKSDSKGVMLPNVALQSRNDVTTVTGTLIEGLWVYNTASSGTGIDRVSPGFYFWDGTRWEKMFNDGFTRQYEQTETLRAANTTTTYTIPGLDQNFKAPYTGKYEIHVTGYIAAPNHLNTSEEATVIGSYMLEINNAKVAESMVSSNTKITPPSSAFQALGRQTTFVHHVNLLENQTYNFKVRARLWSHYNVNPNSLNVSSLCGGAATGYAFFWHLF